MESISKKTRATVLHNPLIRLINPPPPPPKYKELFWAFIRGISGGFRLHFSLIFRNSWNFESRIWNSQARVGV